VAGFVQQLAVGYVANGYWFYVAGSIPEGKDPRTIDAKLIEKYHIDVSKWTRARRKRLGLASVHYMRYSRFFVLLASPGKHPFFREETAIRDIRRFPIRFAGHSVSYRKGRDGKWHASVRIDAVEFKWLKKRFLERAVTENPELIADQISRLPFEPYAPVRNQYWELLRGINSRRKVAGLEPVESEVIRVRRRSVRPFEDLPPPCDKRPE
jgi:hypothetical protein